MYRINQIHENTWIIGEDIRKDFTDSMALVAGSKRAALIDTGCGVGNLKEVVSGLTKLPVTVLTTHVHLDHVGGHPLFDTDGQESEIYASPLEMREWKESGMEAASLKQRMDFLRAAVEGDEERYQKFAKSIVREGYFAYRPLTDGMTLDLGGVSLTACMVPGHTKESFVFVDMERGDAFAGDSINPTPWIFPESGTSVEEYGRAVERFRRKFPEVRHLYSGHCMEDIGVGIIEDTLRCVEEILAGTEDPLVNCYAGEAFEHRTGGVAMLYRRKELDLCIGKN